MFSFLTLKSGSDELHKDAGNDHGEGCHGHEACNEVFRHQAFMNNLLFFLSFGNGVNNFINDQVGSRETN